MLRSRGLAGRGKDPPVALSQQIGTYPAVLSWPRADTLLQHHLQNPSGNCHIFVPFSTEKVQETFFGAWLPTSSTDLKHRHPRSLICYKFCPSRKMKSPISKLPSVGCHCCQHHLQISFSGGCLPSFTPPEPHPPPGRQNHIHIPLLHASTDSFDADHFLMRRVADLTYILFKASNIQLLLVKLFSLFQGK